MLIFLAKLRKDILKLLPLNGKIVSLCHFYPIIYIIVSWNFLQKTSF